MERLTDRRFDELDALIIYIDGMVFGDHRVIGAIGVDGDGCKHLLGIQEGADREHPRGEGFVGTVGGARSGS